MDGLPDDWIAVVRLPCPLGHLTRIADAFPGTVMVSGIDHINGDNVFVLCPATTTQEGPAHV